jgi:hypothetical protein
LFVDDVADARRRRRARAARVAAVDEPGPGGAYGHFGLDEDELDEPPHGEEPDPSLLGDPAGPRVLGPGDGDAGPRADGWEAEADALDAADPYAEDDDEDDRPTA